MSTAIEVIEVPANLNYAAFLRLRQAVGAAGRSCAESAATLSALHHPLPVRA